jgi:Phosphatidylinositol-specific phospholipase C, Y domain/Phosphatidylinositol-specific phospholipase C, X domain
VSLEVHTNHEQQQMMVDIMNECFEEKLCKPIDGETLETLTDLKLPSPDQLRNKILIKVKYSPPSAKAVAAVGEKPLRPTLTRESSADSSSIEDVPVQEEKSKTKKSKIIEALGQLGLYTRSYHFSSLTQPEASVPTHVFSLSESSLIGVHKEDPEGLFDHNKNYLMRAYPKGIRIASSNLNPSLFWRTGVQMVALNWQRIDKGMMLQEAMFSGTGGWAQKPASYLSNSTYKDSRAHLNSGRSWLRISIIAAQNIPMPPSVDSEDKLRPYVKCEVHVEVPDEEKDERRFGKSPKEPKFKKSTDAAKGRHPKFNGKREIMFEDLPPMRPDLSFVR